MLQEGEQEVEAFQSSADVFDTFKTPLLIVSSNNKKSGLGWKAVRTSFSHVTARNVL